MIPKEIVKEALASGFDEALVTRSNHTVCYLKIANSKVDSVVETSGQSGMMFLSSKKRVFFTNLDRFDSAYIRNKIENSKRLIAMQAEKKDYNGLAEGPFKYGARQKYSRRIENYTIDEIADMANSAINSALAEGAQSVAGTLTIGYSKDELATSKSIEAESRSSRLSMSLRAMTKNVALQQEEVSRDMDIDMAKLGKMVASTAAGVKKTGKISDGTYDIIYMPAAGGSLLSNINAMACAGSIETGSFLSGKIGNFVANRGITIYEDGLSGNLVSSSPFDAEGYPSQKTVLVKGGVLKTYLHNYSTAIKYKTKSTGNAGLVEPSPNTLVFEHRNRVSDLDKLISEVKRGILVSSTWYTRFSNYLTGDFSTVPRDMSLYIEDGEPKFAIRQTGISAMVGIRINDNIIRMAKNTLLAANDAIQTTSWDSGAYYVMPSILVKGVRVTTAMV